MSPQTSAPSDSAGWAGVNIRRPNISMSGVLNTWSTGASYVEKTFKNDGILSTSVFTCNYISGAPHLAQPTTPQPSGNLGQISESTPTTQFQSAGETIETIATISASFQKFSQCVAAKKTDALKASKDTIKDAPKDQVAALASMGLLRICSEGADEGSKKCTTDTKLPDITCAAIALRIAQKILSE